VEPPGERTALDEEIDLEAREQDGIQRADQQFVLTDGQHAHVRPASRAPNA
jgi:hypothetical protein